MAHAVGGKHIDTWYPPPEPRTAVTPEMHAGDPRADGAVAEIAAGGAGIQVTNLGFAVPAIEGYSPGPPPWRGIVYPGHEWFVIGAETGDGEVLPAKAIEYWGTVIRRKSLLVGSSSSAGGS